MIPDNHQLTQFLGRLADGHPHSWHELDLIAGSHSSALAVCRALSSVGANLHCNEETAQLGTAFDPLDEASIQARLQQKQVQPLPLVNVYFSVGSTNEKLARLGKAERAHGMTYLAEHQSAGKGRSGRSWLTPLGGQVAMSVCLRFASDCKLEGLSLAVGVGVAQILQAHQIDGVQLKWPNDVLLNGRKLAGILLQVVPEATHNDVILGVGLNYALGAAGDDIDQPWTDLAAASGRSVSRNILAADLLRCFLRVADRFLEFGYGAFKADWELLNAYRGKPVVMIIGQEKHRGTLIGTDGSGAAVVMTQQGRQIFHAGEVSLRHG